MHFLIFPQNSYFPLLKYGISEIPLELHIFCIIHAILHLKGAHGEVGNGQ